MIVTSFFRFTDLSDLREELQEKLLAIPDIKGLIYLTPEGINGMAAGTEQEVQTMKAILDSYPSLRGMDYKDSECPTRPFPRWRVQLKDQTIFYKEQFRPTGEQHRHLSPQEWHELLESGEPVTVLDTRNQYETRVGKFKDAIDPEIDCFTQFSDYLDTCELPKDKKTLIYCTGGIRCEKAILDMEERGFKDVYQLEGGILRYMEHFPDKEFDGECFVFDNRVSLNQELKPSGKFWLCPHCGDPGDFKTTCEQCGGPARLCADCAPDLPTCSKDCTYHWRRKGSERQAEAK